MPYLLETTFDDCLPYPYGPYKEIEWLLIPSEYPHPKSDEKRPLKNKENNLTYIKSIIGGLGKYPIEVSEQGLKIVGYEWQ